MKNEGIVLAIASLTGAVIVPLVVFISHRVKYAGGALAALPIVDLLPILFVGSEYATSQLLGDVSGQVGAFFAISGSYLALSSSAWALRNKNFVIIMFILSAAVLNVIMYFILKR